MIGVAAVSASRFSKLYAAEAPDLPRANAREAAEKARDPRAILSVPSGAAHADEAAWINVSWSEPERDAKGRTTP